MSGSIALGEHRSTICSYASASELRGVLVRMNKGRLVDCYISLVQRPDAVIKVFDSYVACCRVDECAYYPHQVNERLVLVTCSEGQLKKDKANCSPRYHRAFQSADPDYSIRH